MWQMKIDVENKFRPGMPVDQRQEIVRSAKVNRSVRLLAKFWRGFEQLLQPEDMPGGSGWLGLGMADTDEFDVRVVQLKHRKEVRKGWIAPTLVLDATMQPELLRHIWPNFEFKDSIEVEAPHRYIRQVTDNSGALSRFDIDEGREDDEEQKPGTDRKKQKRRLCPKEQKRRTNRLHELHAIICREARRLVGHPVLVVAQKRIRRHLEAMLLPPNVEWAHHNGVAGLDRWGPGPDRDGVRLIIVVGRTQPPPSEVERMREAFNRRSGDQAAWVV